MNLNRRIKSGALQFTVFISVIIALILSGVLLLAYTQKFFVEQNSLAIDNIMLADNAIEALCSQKADISDTIIISLDNMAPGQNAKGIISHWGIFEKAFVTVSHKKKAYSKCALLGTCMGVQKRPAIYLRENYSPLSLVGKAHVEGLSYLPVQGVKPGYIAGYTYNDTELIHGLVKNSTETLPKLKYNYKDILDYYLNKYEPHTTSEYLPLNQQNKIINSFEKPIKGYYSSNTVILDNVSLNGNIIIRSSLEILVKKGAVLHDVVLAAPRIIIDDNVKGNFQAIASEVISVGKNCKLEYPSALVLSKNNIAKISQDNVDDNRISIGQDTTIAGTICYLNSDIQNDFKSNIFIDTGCLLKGEVYCNGNVELKGDIFGSVYTHQFLTNNGGTIFVNHLYDIEINTSKLYNGYGGILLDNEPKSVMKWVY